MGSGCNRDTGLTPGFALKRKNIYIFILVVWFALAFGSENN